MRAYGSSISVIHTLHEYAEYCSSSAGALTPVLHAMKSSRRSSISSQRLLS
jgi:hypothetical protein